jgi:hypothetical protein
MKTMQSLISAHDDAGDVRTFQAYYCPTCDEVRWCPPGDPQCWTEVTPGGHYLIQVWVER